MKRQVECPKCHETFVIDESDNDIKARQAQEQEIERRLAAQKAELNAQKLLAVNLIKSDTQIVTQTALIKKDEEIARLKAQIQQAKIEQELAVTKATNDVEKERDRLQGQLNSAKIEYGKSELELKEQHRRALKEKDEQISYHKELKARLSTKMLGETLEQHCEIEFNKIRSTAFPNAYFEKDNDAKSGSKGDYKYYEIDPESGEKIISIMFEMKNEADQTATKKKNEDFFKELDKDRNEKDCEYAILVSLLEPESELYTGITDVSYRFEKMYVIRPQFFIPIITLLRNAAMKSLGVKRELAIIKKKETDVSRFEDDLNEYKDGIGRLHRLAHERFQGAIDEINNSIKHLESVKEELMKSDKHFKAANNKAEELTIKRLVRDLPAVGAMFAELGTGKSGEKDDK